MDRIRYFFEDAGWWIKDHIEAPSLPFRRTKSESRVADWFSDLDSKIKVFMTVAFSALALALVVVVARGVFVHNATPQASPVAPYASSASPVPAGPIGLSVKAATSEVPQNSDQKQAYCVRVSKDILKTLTYTTASKSTPEQAQKVYDNVLRVGLSCDIVTAKKVDKAFGLWQAR